MIAASVFSLIEEKLLGRCKGGKKHVQRVENADRAGDRHAGRRVVPIPWLGCFSCGRRARSDCRRTRWCGPLRCQSRRRDRANDAEEAVRVMETYGQGMDLLFADVEMPGAMNGFQLAKLVADRWPDTRILVASGQMKPNDGDLPDGAVFVGKPFSADVVHECVNDLLEEERKPRPLRQKFSPD